MGQPKPCAHRVDCTAVQRTSYWRDVAKQPPNAERPEARPTARATHCRTGAQLTTTTPTNPRTGEGQPLQDLSVPPPPTWQPFLRDLVMTLGYREAVSAWPRLARHAAHNYTDEERVRQGTYMEWCRNTLIGLER